MGTFAFVADTTSGLTIVDLAHPASPAWYSFYDTSGSTLGLEIYGNQAFLADGSGGLVVLPLDSAAVDRVDHVSGNTYRTVLKRPLPATYNVVVGPNIADLQGRRPDADRDAHAGEWNEDLIRTTVTAPTRAPGIYGTKFRDADGDGLARELHEPGVEGWTIFLDQNSNGGMDAGERSSLTDVHGDYAFVDLAAGPYRVDEVADPAWRDKAGSAGWAFALTAGQVLAGVDFGNFRVVDAGLDRQALEGDSLPFTALVQDPDSTVVSSFTYLWHVTAANGQAIPDSTAPTFSFVPSDDGEYQVRVTVRDSQDSRDYTDTVTVFVGQRAPQWLPGANPTTDEGTLTPFDLGALLGNAETGPWTVRVQWGDGDEELFPVLSAGALSASKHAYRNDGAYTVTVTVTDDDGQQSAGTFLVTVNNLPPTAEIKGSDDQTPVPTTAVEGELIRLTGIVTDPGGDPIQAYAWTVTKNGQPFDAFEETLADPAAAPWSVPFSFTPDDEGTYVVTLTACDDAGAETTVPAQVTIQVTNGNPVAAILNAPSGVTEGTTVTLSSRITDPGLLDTFRGYQWTVTRDGQPFTLPQGTATNEASFTFVPGSEGLYRVSLTVQDNAGASSPAAEAVITVVNVPPADVAILGLPSDGVREGQTVLLTAGFSDPGSETFGYLWTVTRDGQPFGNPGTDSTLTFTPTDDGSYSINLTVGDGLAAASATRQVAVTGVAPTGTPFVSLTAIDEGSPFTFGLTDLSEPSPTDVADGLLFSFDLDGDGVYEIVDVAAAAHSVTLTQSGRRTLRARVRDADGLSTSYALAVQIGNVVPAVTVNQASVSVSQGQTAQLAGSFADPGADRWRGLATITKAGDPLFRVVAPVVLNDDKTFRWPYAFGAAGSYTVTFDVTDDEPAPQAGGQGGFVLLAGDESDSVLVTVGNVLPVFDPLSAASTVAGRTFTRQVSFRDPGNDAWTWSVDYGDGGSFTPFQSTDDPSDPTDSLKAFELSHVYTTPGDYTVRVQVSDQPGSVNPVTATFAVHVAANQAPAVQSPISDLTVREGTSARFNYADLATVFQDPDNPAAELQFTVVGNTRPTLVTPVPDGDQNLDLFFAAGQTGTAEITIRATDPVGAYAEDTFTVMVLASTFRVLQALPSASGVAVQLNRALDPAPLNLYDGEDAPSDAADVALVGAATGPVRGSLVWNEPTRTLTFVASGGALAPDNYTLALHSRADGLVTSGGELLDGDSDGVAGGSWITQFQVASSAGRVLSLPDFARGPNQPVAVPATGNGFPIRISDGSGVVATDFTLRWDPELLTVTAVRVPAALTAAGWTVEANLTTPGMAVISVGGTSAAPAGSGDLVMIEAHVPETAPYGAAQVIGLDGVRINEGQLDASADLGLHKVAYLGDTTGNARYLGLDAALIARVAVGLDSGLDAFAATDPRILADVTGDGTLSALDWSYVAQKTVGLPRPEIPDLPANLPPAVAGGVDPTLAIPAGITVRQGDAVVVPVSITDDAAGVMSALVVIDYDPAKLDADYLDVALGSMLSGLTGHAAWTLTTNVDDIAGRITVLAITAVPLAGGPGELLQINFHARPDAGLGSTPLDLVQGRNYLNEDRLTVTTVDGSLVIEPGQTPTLTVTEFTPTDSGFVARFGREVDPSVLNLYDSASQTLGPADLALVGATQGLVRGSLLVSADRREVTFLKTGGLLEPDAYTVTLFSGATRFRDKDGGALDGNGDGTLGDNYQAAFTIASRAAGTVTVSLPDIARGAGQAVHVPAGASGSPIRTDNAAGVTSLAVDVRYDPSLLSVSGGARAAGLPADWSVSVDTGTASVARIVASGMTPLAGTNVDVARLTATVPASAPYGASQAIRLENLSLNGGAIAAIGDVAVHKAAYLGDADGSGIHSAADAFLVVQAALGLASGFSAHAWTDRRIAGDADGSGVLSAADAFLIVQEGLGLSEPFVPDNPRISPSQAGGGIDPQFRIDVGIPAVAGGTVTVPVMLDIESAATNVGGIDFDLFFDPARLTIDVPQGVSGGADTARGWAISSRLVAPGQLRVGLLSASGQPLVPGLREIAELVFHVAASFQDASSGLGEAGLREDLDIEPVDPRAGGYVWTAVDGSVSIVAANAWHNAFLPFDVNGDGLATPADVLVLINYLNSHPGESGLPSAASLPARYLDVDGDQACTARDVLAGINHLNATAARKPSPDDPRDHVFGNLEGELSPLDDVLADLADDIASAWW